MVNPSNPSTPKQLILRPATTPAPKTPHTDPRKRSCSPAKTTINVPFAKVEFRVFDVNQIPESPHIDELLKDIQDAAAGVAVVPRNARTEFSLNTKNAIGNRLRPININSQSQAGTCIDIHDLLAIIEDAAYCRAQCQSGAIWNMRVHSPLLRLAVERTTSFQMRVWPATTATITPEFLPRDVMTGGLPSSPLVDFCIAIESGIEEKRIIEQLLASKSDSSCSINQTSYPPLCSRPIAIPVEFKTDDTEEPGEIQLAIWTKAWLIRMKALNATDIPYLPLLRIEGHNWFLLLAWEEYTQDRHDGEHEEQHRGEPTLVIMSKLPIGGTECLLDVYRLVKVLQRLSTWANGPFRQWHEHVVARACSLDEQCQVLYR
ncbi:hypothetical protein GGR51DRAFT_503309 [Nemania sp. FL0031]|nr:hypothetical protein GGR51DRAFT_503309 [Nemania sp. FL0031]